MLTWFDFPQNVFASQFSFYSSSAPLFFAASGAQKPGNSTDATGSLTSQGRRTRHSRAVAHTVLLRSSGIDTKMSLAKRIKLLGVRLVTDVPGKEMAQSLLS